MLPRCFSAGYELYFGKPKASFCQTEVIARRKPYLSNTKSCWAASSSQLKVKSAANANIYAYHPKRLDLKDKYCARVPDSEWEDTTLRGRKQYILLPKLCQILLNAPASVRLCNGLPYSQLLCCWVCCHSLLYS